MRSSHMNVTRQCALRHIQIMFSKYLPTLQNGQKTYPTFSMMCEMRYESCDPQCDPSHQKGIKISGDRPGHNIVGGETGEPGQRISISRYHPDYIRPQHSDYPPTDLHIYTTVLSVELTPMTGHHGQDFKMFKLSQYDACWNRDYTNLNQT